MARKKNRPTPKREQAEPVKPVGAKGKRRWNTPSLVFIGILVLLVAAVVGSQLLGDRPDCPPGQVWSNAHDHCH